MGFLQSVDLGILIFLNRRLECGLLDAVMPWITRPANWIPFLALLGIALLLWGRPPVALAPPSGAGLFLWARDSRLVLLSMLLAVGASDLASNAVKHAVTRQRPCRDPSTAPLVTRRAAAHGNRSFPSAHAANSAALATVAGLAYPPLAVPGAIFSMLVGASRVYNGVHYPFDVAAGWLVGLMTGAGVWSLVAKKLSVREVVAYAARFRSDAREPSAAPRNGRWEPFRFRSLDGWGIEGWLSRGGRQVAVLCHGLHSGVSSMGVPAEAFSARGFTVLLVPFRGHDGHPLARTTGGPDEAMDLSGALMTLLESGIGGEDILIYGASMGASVAVKTACLLSTGPLMGVIAHGCYTGFFDAARSKLGAWRTAVLRALMPRPVRRSLDAFRPGDYLAQAFPRIPFVFMCGSWDTVTPPEMSRRLASAAPLGAAVILGGSGHPKWGDPSRENRWQFEKALDQALGLIREPAPDRTVFVDEEGRVRDVPRLSPDAAGTGKGGR